MLVDAFNRRKTDFRSISRLQLRPQRGGDDAISFTKTVDDSNMYYVISMCKQKEQAPYSFVLYKDGQPHTLTTREACTSNGIETISLPAKNFPDATSLSIINIGNTDLVVSVYEVKEPHHE